MVTVGDKVKKIRSKNAGPFWITVDVFCGDEEVFRSLCDQLTDELIANLYQVPKQTLKRFELVDLWVLKFSFPRKVIQGSRHDRDMHGAQMSVLLSEMELPG